MKTNGLFQFAERGDLKTSANNIKQNGTYSIMGSGGTLGLPLDYGVLVSFNLSGYFSFQICSLGSDFHIRSCDNGTWSPWKKATIS